MRVLVVCNEVHPGLQLAMTMGTAELWHCDHGHSLVMATTMHGQLSSAHNHGHNVNTRYVKNSGERQTYVQVLMHS